MKYASLIGPLLGIYYPLPFEDEEKNRLALNTSRLKNLWCRVYSEEEVNRQIKSFGGIKLPVSQASNLDYDSAAVLHNNP